MTDFVTETGRYNEVSFYGVIEMSLKVGAKQALNNLAHDTHEHDLPSFCFASGTNTGNGWVWEVKTYMRQVTVCKPPTKEDAEVVMSAINEAYKKWEDKRVEEDRTNKIEELINKCWL